MQAKVADPQQVAELLAAVVTHVNGTAQPDMFRLLSELEISFTQMKVLFVLERSPELALTDLAGRLAMSLPAMSRSIDGLVKLGYVGRRESDEDRRSRLVTLLPHGREALARVSEARNAVIAAFAATLPDDERTALRDALLPIAERIGPA
ncbi:MAG: MarR family transcriptional regulator [Candidatus Rokuibacteriota bacterium]